MFSQAAIERAIAEFEFDDYGMDDVSIAISEDPETQEWIPKLAERVAEVATPNRHWLEQRVTAGIEAARAAGESHQNSSLARHIALALLNEVR